ncbi:MAG: hypothetical protein AB9861_17330 [Methanosarcina sp.]
MDEKTKISTLKTKIFTLKSPPLAGFPCLSGSFPLKKGEELFHTSRTTYRSG